MAQSYPIANGINLVVETGVEPGMRICLATASRPRVHVPDVTLVKKAVPPGTPEKPHRRAWTVAPSESYMLCYKNIAIFNITAHGVWPLPSLQIMNFKNMQASAAPTASRNGITLQELVDKTHFDLGRIKKHKPAQVLSDEGLATTYIYVYGDREPMIGSTTLPLMGLRIYNLPFGQLLQMLIYFGETIDHVTDIETIQEIFELYENTNMPMAIPMPQNSEPLMP